MSRDNDRALYIYVNYTLSRFFFNKWRGLSLKWKIIVVSGRLRRPDVRTRVNANEPNAESGEGETLRLQSMYTLSPIYSTCVYIYINLFCLPTLLQTGNLLFTVRLFDPVNNMYMTWDLCVCPPFTVNNWILPQRIKSPLSISIDRRHLKMLQFHVGTKR